VARRAWEQLAAWVTLRQAVAPGPLFCVLSGPTRRPAVFAPRTSASNDTLLRAGVRRRFAPHQLRHAHAVEMSREGVSLVVIQRQLGHAHLGLTKVYLRGISNSEIISTVHDRDAPMIRARAHPTSISA
jgi:site-specific recombinase XerC